MTVRNVTLKNVGGDSHQITIEEHTTFDQFVDQVCEIMQVPEDKTVKIISQGKIITVDDFGLITDGSSIISVPAKRKVEEPTPPAETSTSIEEPVANHEVDPVPQSEVPIPTQNAWTEDNQSQSTHNEPYNKSTENETEPQYTFEEVRAAFIVLMNFVRDNPQVSALYQQDFGGFVNEILTNPTLINITKNIVSQSGQILHSIKTGGNISVNINGDSGKVNQIELTPHDEEMVKNIVEMGFPADRAMRAYIESGKNPMMAIELLTSGQI